MNRIHRFGDNAEIDEKNRVRMYKKGKNWVTASQTSFMLLGKHALAKSVAITLGTVALGLASSQAASADSVASTSSGTQPTTGEPTNSSDSGSSNTVTLKSSGNTSEEDTGTTTSGNSNTDQAASTAVMTNSSAAEALQANLASMSTTSGSLNTDNNKSTITTANEQSAAASTTSNQLTDKSESSRIMAKAATLSTSESSDASSVIDNAGQNSKAQSGTITLSEMYKNNHLPDLQEKLYDGDRAVRTTEFHPDEIFDNTQVDYDQDTSTKTINNVWNQNYLNFNLNTYVSKELNLGTPKDGLFYNLQIDDRLAKHITSIEITNSQNKVIALLTRAAARKAGQNVGDYDDDVYCAKFTDIFPGSDETRTASGVIHFDGVIKDILSQTTDNDLTKLPLGYRSYVSYEGNTAFTTTSLFHGNQNYPSKSILGASYTNGFFITPTTHILDQYGKDEGEDGGFIGNPMFYGYAQKGIFSGGTDDVYYDVKNRAIVIDNYINRKSKFTYDNNGWKYELKIDPRLLPYLKSEQTYNAQGQKYITYGKVGRVEFKNGTFSTHYTREEIRNQSSTSTNDLTKRSTSSLDRTPEDGEYVAELNNVAPDVEGTRPWIIRTVLSLGEDSQGSLYTLTSVLKSIFEDTANSSKQPALQFQSYLATNYGKIIEGTTSSNLSSFAELANSVSDNTEDQGLFVIDFVDENQQAQGAFTLEGKTGTTQEFTASFPDGWTFAGDSSKLPNGWTINSQGQLTGKATLQSFDSANATWLLVKHGTYTVAHNAATQGTLAAKDSIIPGTTAKKFAQDINYSDLNKTLTRTITIDDPHKGKQTQTQTVDFACDANVDMVTGEVTYTSWQAVDPTTRAYDTDGKYNYYDAVEVPTVAGYTPSQITVEKVYPNGASDTDTSVEVTYTANAGTQTIDYQYEKADGSTVSVGTQVIKGKTDETVSNVAWELPDGYVLADGVSLPSEVTIQATDTPMIIKVNHLKVTVTHDNPQAAGTLIPGTKDKYFGNGVTQNDLNHNVKRTINVTYPDGTATKQIVQEVKFVRDATVDAVTGEVTYTGWSNADANTKFEALDNTALGLKSIDGYTPTETSVAEAVPAGDDNDQTINISYTKNGDVSQTFTLIDDDDNAKEYTVALSGTKGTQGTYKDVAAYLPTGMTFADPNDESKTFEYAESGSPIQIHVKHQTQLQDNDTKAVTRKIILQLPDGTSKTEPQSVWFKRSVTKDLFNNHLTYGDWQYADSTKTGFEEYTPATQAGYHPTSTSESFKDGKVTAVDKVSADTVYPAVTITYAANDQSFKIVYQDEQGNEIKSDTVSGKTGTTVKINSTVPTGWKLTDGQTVPTEFTFETTGAKDLTYTIKHAVVTVTADNPKTTNDQLPDNPAMKYPKGVAHDDLNKNVTRTIIINLPNGNVQRLQDTVAFTRNANVDEVDDSVTYTDWTSNNSTWADRTDEIPDNAGYTKLYQDTDGQTLSNSVVQSMAVTEDMPNVTVVVKYSADAQTITINYLDDQNNSVGTGNLTGETGKKMTIDQAQLNPPTGWVVDDGQTLPITITPGADASKNVVNIKVKQLAAVKINYLDDQNNVIDTSSLNGEVGKEMQIKKDQLSIPDGWTVDDSQALPITITPDTDATKNVVNVKIKHLIVKVNNDNYYSGELIPGTTTKHFGDYNLSHVVQRTVYVYYEKTGRGSTSVPAGSARFTREAWVDAVTGKIVSYEKWVSKGDSFIEFLLSNEGHGFDPSDIENFAKVYKVNGQFADSTVLDRVTPYVNEDGDIVTEVGGITVKNNDVNIDVDYLYLKYLSDVLNTVPATKQTYKYLNASSDKAKAYDTSVTDGQNLLKKLEDTSIVQTSTQDDIDAAMNAITKAEAELDGKETNYKDLQKAVDDAPTNKQTDAYLNATDQKVYDKAVAAGDDILKAHTSGSIYSQADVDAAVKAIKDALNGQATNYNDLQKAVNDAPTNKQTEAYLNATDQKAYDDAVAAGQKILDEQKAGQAHSQTEVDAAVKAIKDALNGQATDYAALQKAVDDAPDNRKTYEYINATDQKAYDDAVAAGEKLLDGKAHSQSDVNAAVAAINNALNGHPTDNTQLKKDVEQGTNTKQDIKYRNADPDKQKALDDAINHGQDVLNDPTADQKTVDQADQAIKDAMNDLNGQPTDKSELQKDINKGNQIKNTDAYKNADPDKQKALDDAIKYGQDVLDDQNADQKTVNNADQAIKDALKNLNGQATDKSQLQKDIGQGNQTKQDDKYRNADPDKQKSLDDAINHGQDVLNDQNADQKTVDQADQAIKDAMNDLNGQPTDKSELQKDVNKGNQTKNTDAYKNADSENQKTLDDSIKQGQDVLNDPTADQKKVDDADQAIKDALKNLNGQATDKTQLQKDVDQGNQTKDDDSYKNADADKQKALDDAIKHGQDVLDDKNTDQKTVDDADRAIKDALKDLNGQVTDKSQLQKDVVLGNQTKNKDTYKNASQDAQKALDDAVNHGQDVLNDQNADQKTVDQADQAIKDALKNLNGQATDKTQLQQDINQGNQIKQDDKYQKADPDKQKALDDAVKYGQDILNDPTVDQKTVDDADQTIKDALNDLNGQATDKTQLQKDVNQGNQAKNDDSYKNADADKQKALDDAIKHGQDVLNDKNADQKAVDDADQAIKDALKDLNGQVTDKTQLQKDINQGNQIKQDDKYQKADPDKQKALDDAINYGEDVLNNKNADQKTVDDADRSIKDALKDLNGKATDKSQLQNDVDQASQTKQDDKYRNADPDKQKELDDAIKHGQDVLNDPTADQKTVDAADQAIKDAQKDLNGQATDKSQLQKDVDKCKQTKQTDAYKNASQAAQKALDDAVNYGEDVLNDQNADQKTVNDADHAITDALKNLNGETTDKSQLQKDVNQASQAKNTDTYKNADSDKQKALDDAIKHGQEVLNDPTADQKTVDAADQAIKDAQKDLNGQATDKGQLQNDVNQANQIKNGDAYKNASQAAQKALDNAIKHGQDVLNDPNADQEAVDEAAAELEQAMKAIQGNDSEIPNDNGTNQNGNSQSAATATDSKSQNNDSTAIQAPNSQSSAENQKQNGQSNMQTLPQTGNQEGAWTVLTGLMATMLGSLGLMLGKKKGHDEEKN